MITVQPIRPEEIDQFIGASGHAAEVKQYLEQMLSIGSIRTEWCYVAKENNQLLGRVAYWTLPAVGKPLAMVLLDLPWERTDYLAVGESILQETFQNMRALGVKHLEYVLDAPVMAPQWQAYPEERIRLLERIGFHANRETYRFEWKSPNFELAAHEGLRFKTLAETGEAAFIEAIERVSDSILDRREQQDMKHFGAAVHARNLFKDLQDMDFEPHWWQLAYNLHGDLVGLVMPAQNPTYATIAFIGVVPEQRGRGYIDVLLNKGTAILLEAGISMIRADTDVNNFPMANAFKRQGYVQFAVRREFTLELGS